MSFIKNRNDVIAYTVDKTNNTSLYISIQNGEVIVKAPWFYTTDQIQAAVETKKNWILKHLQEYIENETIKNSKFNNEPIQIFGKPYDLILKYGTIANPTLNLQKKHIEIILPAKYIDANKQKIIDVTIAKMYSSIAKAEIENIMEDARHLLGFAPEDFKIQKLDKTLAKCENGIITINPEIMQYSKEAIHFIVIHEFCHLKFKTHSKKFYELMRKYIFNYDEIAKQVEGLKF